MSSRLDDVVHYQWTTADVLEPMDPFELNPFVGKEVRLSFLNEIHCIATGKKIKKTFGEGLSYDAWLTSPAATPSILRPELSRIHEGIALRDFDWEQKNHNQPHFVYLTRTSDIKVGVTRSSNVPYRWIDQGASEGILIAQTPYRQLAGLIEVAMKDHFSDKTHWQNMLKNVFTNLQPMIDAKEDALGLLPEEYQEFIFDDDAITKIEYPVLRYPVKVRSIKLDKEPEIVSTLVGIKGQYLIFENGAVLNVRSHAGYRVCLEV
ncbi:MAG: DUF2797 domain-containing protein [Flavobacteriales bacterium]|nr:DUF2797 domain-containing protein [Flavobacteriales bacterium]